MSGSTVAGGSVAQQFTGSAAAALNSFFSSGTPFTVLPPTSGAFTASGPVVVAAPNLALTLSGATAVADTSTGGTSITTTTPSAVFAAPNDTITSAAATTLFGASGGGIDHFSISGANSSITGGTGSIVGTASGSNSTLVGGTGISIFNVTGPNSLAVAGSAGVTGINEQASTGPRRSLQTHLGTPAHSSPYSAAALTRSSAVAALPRLRAAAATTCSPSLRAMPAGLRSSSASTQATTWLLPATVIPRPICRPKQLDPSAMSLRSTMERRSRLPASITRSSHSINGPSWSLRQEWAGVM